MTSDGDSDLDLWMLNSDRTITFLSSGDIYTISEDKSTLTSSGDVLSDKQAIDSNGAGPFVTVDSTGIVADFAGFNFSESFTEVTVVV